MFWLALSFWNQLHMVKLASTLHVLTVIAHTSAPAFALLPDGTRSVSALGSAVPFVMNAHLSYRFSGKSTRRVPSFSHSELDSLPAPHSRSVPLVS